DSNFIKMDLRGVQLDPAGIFSPVHRINGFPWRLYIADRSNGSYSAVWLYCDKSTESDLWQCKASLQLITTTTCGTISCFMHSYTYASWMTEN
ncbi:hypothetical protein PFISCL1PPCAC_12283, partial [Pristionchus fissidentatus]